MRMKRLQKNLKVKIARVIFAIDLLLATGLIVHVFKYNYCETYYITHDLQRHHMQ